VSKPKSDPGAEHEPHLQGGTFRVDPSEHTARPSTGPIKPTEAADHTVWDEPALAATDTPADALTYARWLDARQAETSTLKTWLVTLGILLGAGLFAVAGTFISQAGEMATSQVLLITVIGPIIEEIMKACLILWVIEKRPYLFSSRIQIALTCLASGLVFAIIENLIYLNVYVKNPPQLLVEWRWTICVALHTGCTFIASLGLMRIWTGIMTERRRPRLIEGTSALVAAIVLHGTYNAFCIALAHTEYNF